MVLNTSLEPEKCPSCKVKLDDEFEKREDCTLISICHRYKYHLVLPLLLLPVILLLLGIVRLVGRPHPESENYQSSDAFNGKHGLEEFTDRDLINGLKTSFVPIISKTLPLSMLPFPNGKQTIRNRRNLKDIILGVHDIGNLSDIDTIEWSQIKPAFNYTRKINNLDNEEDTEIKKDEYDDKYKEITLQDDEEKEVQEDVYLSIKQKKNCRKCFWEGEKNRESIRIVQAQIMLSLMNRSVDPCEDFYEFACGGWINMHPIPKNRAGSGTIEILKTHIDEVVRGLLENEVNIVDQSNNSGKKIDDSDHSELRSIKSLTKVPIHEEMETDLPIDESVLDSTSLSFSSSSLDIKSEGHPSKLENKGNSTDENLRDGSQIESLLETKLENNNGSQFSNAGEILELFLDEEEILKNSSEVQNIMFENVADGNKNIDTENSMLKNNSVFYYLQLFFSLIKAKYNIRSSIKKSIEKNVSQEVHVNQEDLRSIMNVSSGGDNHFITKLLNSVFVPINISNNEDKKIIRNLSNDDDFHPVNKAQEEKKNFDLEKNLKNRDNEDILSKSERQQKPLDATVKARKFYKSCMNFDLINKRAEKPLLALLEELGGGWPKQTRNNKKPFEWITLAAKLRLYNNNILIAEWVGPDMHNSTEYVIQLDEAGLGLPTRDYFLSASNTDSLNAYRQFIVTVANLLGSNNEDAEKLADEIVNFEIHLALITATHEEKKNMTELYQRMTIDELSEAVPGINWREYFSIVLSSSNPNYDLSTLNSTTILVFALRYFRDLSKLLDKYPPRVIQSYMLWRFASHRAGNLDQRFWLARSQLRKTLTGREEAPPRWESCVAHTTAAFGHAVGSLFVKQHFDEQSKSDTLLMIDEIQIAFRNSILDPNGSTATWMDAQTRSLAVEKVDAMALRVGYPDTILDSDLLDLRYSNLDVDSEKYFENTLAVLKYLTCREHSFLGRKVEKSDWSAPPTEVNAFYSRNRNQIFLPAGILQPPFYHRYFPRSLNYGGVGVVIGHEMTHGFDDRGRLFDKHGNIQKWWQPSAVESFQQRAECLVDQYQQYYVGEVDMQIDGMRTKSENIADNGGLKHAYKAYVEWSKKYGRTSPDEAEETLPELNVTPRQLFFLNFAQVWCGALRPEAIRNKLKTSIHSIEKFRVIGSLSNSEEFAEAYSCPLGSPMNPEVKCSVW